MMASRKERSLSDFQSAEDAVRCVLLAALPPDVPPSFRAVVSASFEGIGRRRRAVADLIMFDGQPATAEVFAAAQFEDCTCWGHRWTSMPGGASAYEDGEWVRYDDEGNIVSKQSAFDFSSDVSPSASGAL